MKYSFTIVVKPYKRENVFLDSVRVIYNGNTCIVAKNEKFGGFYIHKNARIVQGKFHWNAGSHSSPLLFPKNTVKIKVKDFHSKPNILTDQIHPQDFIQVIDLIESN